MRFFVAAVAVVAAALLHHPARANDDESPDAYEIVTATAVPVLPTPLRAFFENHLEEIQRSATSHVVSASTPYTPPSEADRHYVMLDVAARGNDAAARHAAAQQFPRDREAAIELAKRQGVRHGGLLPWVIHDRYDALVQAFQSGEQTPIVREAGALLHFGTDAALPFNTTTDRDGAAASHVRWPDNPANRPNALHHTVRQRCHLGLLARLRTRLAYEVRVSPQRYRRISYAGGVLNAVFDLLVETHSWADVFLAMDAQAVAELGITDAETFSGALDRYYDKLADRAAPFMEARLEEAALLSANLIGTAWVRAGSPAPETWNASTSQLSREAPSANKPENTFVGSRHSMVFHRATCGHAKRIKPDNLISFETAQEARNAGRAPCRTCKPDGP